MGRLQCGRHLRCSQSASSGGQTNLGTAAVKQSLRERNTQRAVDRRAETRTAPQRLRFRPRSRARASR